MLGPCDFNPQERGRAEGGCITVLIHIFNSPPVRVSTSHFHSQDIFLAPEPQRNFAKQTKVLHMNPLPRVDCTSTFPSPFLPTRQLLKSLPYWWDLPQFIHLILLFYGVSGVIGDRCIPPSWMEVRIWIFNCPRQSGYSPSVWTNICKPLTMGKAWVWESDGFQFEFWLSDFLSQVTLMGLYFLVCKIGIIMSNW